MNYYGKLAQPTKSPHILFITDIWLTIIPLSVATEQKATLFKIKLLWNFISVSTCGYTDSSKTGNYSYVHHPTAILSEWIPMKVSDFHTKNSFLPDKVSRATKNIECPC